MAYDADLADRVRSLLGRLVAERGLGPIEEKRMFGALSFMAGGRLAVAVGGSGGLLVPVGSEQPALLGDLVEPMTMGRRTSDTWVRVLPAAVATDGGLQEWVERGLRQVSEA